MRNHLALPLRVDPALGLDEQGHEWLSMDLEDMPGSRMTFVPSGAHAIAVAEVVRAEGEEPHLLVRRATRRETADFLALEEDEVAEDGY